MKKEPPRKPSSVAPPPSPKPQGAPPTIDVLGARKVGPLSSRGSNAGQSVATSMMTQNGDPTNPNWFKAPPNLRETTEGEGRFDLRDMARSWLGGS